ncbi:RadC family protein [Nautilia sp.]
MKKLNELYHKDKPREKLIQKGVKALQNDELIAILIGSGIKGKDVRKLSKEIEEIIDKNFPNLSPEKLFSIKGLGNAKVSVILAAVELGRRYYTKNNNKINDAKDTYELLKEYANKKQEYFLSITLDGAMNVINKRVVFIGTLNQSIIHPREIFADAIADRANSIIIAHNHPSGELTPSGNDIEITKRLQEVGKLIGIELLDHLIITKEGFYSFSQEGMLI